jgi:hypothetical protein
VSVSALCHSERGEESPILRLIAILALCLWSAAGAWAQGEQKTPVAPGGPEARVEFFGAERGYTVGQANVTLLCVVRNVGTAPLPENALRLRLFPVAGLDYTSGETVPRLPALEVNQAVAVRWRLAPLAEKGPLVAGLLLEKAPPPAAQSGASRAVSQEPRGAVSLAGQPSAPPIVSANSLLEIAPRTYLAVVPRFATAPSAGSLSAKPGSPPTAEADASQAWVGNDRVGVRVIAAERRLPALLLLGKEGTAWRVVATGTPLAQARSGEEGQLPWWQTFRWRSARTTHDKDSATLTLIGTCGIGWRAELSLTAQRDSSALNGVLRLTALLPQRLSGVQWPLLLTGSEEPNAAPPRADGTPLPVAAEPALLPEHARVVTARQHGITFGLSWPSALPLPGWQSAPLPAGDGDRARILGALCEAEERGALISRGATVEFPFRLFAFAPSDTVRDALRFALP